MVFFFWFLHFLGANIQRNRYLLIDYYIAELTSRSTAPDRKAALRRAREEYSRFLQRLDAYDILASGDKKLYEQFQEAPDTFSTAPASDAVARREAKIARYREEKQLKEKLEVGAKSPPPHPTPPHPPPRPTSFPPSEWPPLAGT